VPTFFIDCDLDTGTLVEQIEDLGAREEETKTGDKGTGSLLS